MSFKALLKKRSLCGLFYYAVITVLLPSISYFRVRAHEKWTKRAVMRKRMLRGLISA